MYEAPLSDEELYNLTSTVPLTGVSVKVGSASANHVGGDASIDIVAVCV